MTTTTSDYTETTHMRPAPRSVAARPRRVAGRDALVLLREDHRRVDGLFKRFTRGKDAGPARKQALARKICAELTIHTRLEEELLYPAARAVLGDKGQELLDEAEVEHGSVRDLIAQIESASPGDPLYDARVMVLGEYIRHHVEEEHDDLFPTCRKAKLETKALGARMQERRRELVGARRGRS